MTKILLATSAAALLALAFASSASAGIRLNGPATDGRAAMPAEPAADELGFVGNGTAHQGPSLSGWNPRITGVAVDDEELQAKAGHGAGMAPCVVCHTAN